MSSLLRSLDGTTTIEFALVVMPLLVLLMGIVKVGQVVWVQNVLNYSVEEAARCGAVDPTICATSGEVQTFAASAAGSGIQATYTATTQPCGSDVTATYPDRVIAPFINFSFNLSAHACYPK